MANPIALPVIGWRECQFDPFRPRSTNYMENRKTESMTHGTPWWKAVYTAGRLTRKQIADLDAFMMQAGDDGETFLAYDVFRPRPIAYDAAMNVPLSGTKAAGGAFNGDGGLQSITNPFTVVINGLPANFQLTRGDYIEIRKSLTKRSLHRIMNTVTGNASGVATISIKYGLDTQHFTLPCTIHLEKPSCIMQMDPGTWQGTKSWASREPSFSASEVFFET